MTGEIPLAPAPMGKCLETLRLCEHRAELLSVVRSRRPYNHIAAYQFPSTKIRGIHRKNRRNLD